jgi:hypothetical protein
MSIISLQNIYIFTDQCNFLQVNNLVSAIYIRSLMYIQFKLEMKSVTENEKISKK